MVGVLHYAYCPGVRSSRKIAQALEEDVGFRVVAANQQPDFRTICRFRAEHEGALERLFIQVLRLCREAGLVQLGAVALGGTKVEANAALAANREYQSLEAEVRQILAEAKATDAKEDARYGPERRGDELPEGLGNRTHRLQRLLEAKANVTDPASRIMKTRRGYVEGYHVPAVVSEDQIIVAIGVTQEENDQHQLTPMLQTLKRTLEAAGIAERPRVVLADAG